uniref:Uncharacterized protein n=1 Tax=Parastrongyloides trichosuri TaxID=131310 RepID=A0A0N4ZCH6_PARTI
MMEMERVNELRIIELLKHFETLSDSKVNIDYQKTQQELLRILPKDRVHEQMKLVSPRKFHALLPREIRTKINQCEMTKFILNEYIEYDYKNRMQYICQLIKMINMDQLSGGEFVGHILYNKNVQRDYHASLLCYLYIESEYCNMTIKKAKKESKKKGILNFDGLSEFMDVPMKKYENVNFSKNNSTSKLEIRRRRVLGNVITELEDANKEMKDNEIDNIWKYRINPGRPINYYKNKNYGENKLKRKNLSSE